jgi:serine/threonine-protein kinase
MLSSVDQETAGLDPTLLRARSRLGTVLREKWRLDVLLGFGGMAAVYAATHRNGSRVAVKVLHAELSTNAVVRQRFLREGYVANTVAHDGAVKVADDDVAEDGAAFLVMELLDGETLEERRIRFNGQLSEDEVLSVADQLLDVLIAAHMRGVIHRDLKPENVFVTRDGRVKVLDFGIARLRELSTASTATKAGSTMGTPAFMAYEQARGLWEAVDARTDLWAVGAIMFTLLSGKCVHEGRTTQEVLLSAMTVPAPPLASVVPNVSLAVAHVIDRALAQEKERRWPDATRMQERVRDAYHDRFKVPIGTAPRLTVPETVPNRTLAGSDSSAGSGSAPYPIAVRQPTTGQPVANSQSGARGGATPPWIGPAIGGGLAILVTIIVAVAVTVRHPAGSASASATAAVPVAAPSAGTNASAMRVTAASASSASPAIDVTNLPTATEPAPTATVPPTATVTTPPATAKTTSAPALSSTGSTSAKSNCSPPYVIDPVTKKKVFKVECL